MNMLLKAVIAIGALGTSQMSSAIMIDIDGLGDTDVGQVDTILAFATDLNVAGTCVQPGGKSNPTVEDCWADYIVGEDLTYEGKTEDVNIYFGTGTDVDYAGFTLEFMPSYYIMKNTSGWVLVKNEDNLAYGVINLTDTKLASFNITISTTAISHVSEFSGSTTTQVPEPGSLALFGIGLVGLGLGSKWRLLKG